jgi:hypothetical protein
MTDDEIINEASIQCRAIIRQAIQRIEAIKPEPRKPREWDLKVWSDGTISDARAGVGGEWKDIVHVREVIE